MANTIEHAIRQICDEKGISYESVIKTIEAALAAAYRKDFADKYHNLEAEFNPADGSVRVFDVKHVVENITLEELEELRRLEAEEQANKEARRALGQQPLQSEVAVEEAKPAFNPKTDIMLSDARILKLSNAVGDVLRTELPIPGEFGRMAAMTAKQVITQKLREAEREIILTEFKDAVGTIITGMVQRMEGRILLVDIGRTTGVIRPEDQSPADRYLPGSRLKFYVREVGSGPRGPQILLSRTHEGLLRHLFEAEIPEITDGAIEIKSIAREAGARSKVAVVSRDQRVDAIGACIGQRGTRIQTIIAELSGEKIDMIEWDPASDEYIRNALAPARVSELRLNEAERVAVVTVPVDQLSLAIGRGGQNVRLASKLTGWKINIEEERSTLSPIEIEEEASVEAVEESAVEPTIDLVEPVADSTEPTQPVAEQPTV